MPRKSTKTKNKSNNNKDLDTPIDRLLKYLKEHKIFHYITKYLDLHDVLNCSLSYKLFRDVIIHSNTYWKENCIRFFPNGKWDLQDETLEKSGAFYNTFLTLRRSEKQFLSAQYLFQSRYYTVLYFEGEKGNPDIHDYEYDYNHIDHQFLRLKDDKLWIITTQDEKFSETFTLKDEEVKGEPLYGILGTQKRWNFVGIIKKKKKFNYYEGCTLQGLFDSYGKFIPFHEQPEWIQKILKASNTVDMCVDQSKTYFVYAMPDRVRVISYETGKPLFSIRRKDAQSICTFAMDKLIAVGYSNGTLSVRNIETRKSIFEETPFKNPPTSVISIAMDNYKMVAAFSNNRIRVYNKAFRPVLEMWIYDSQDCCLSELRLYPGCILAGNVAIYYENIDRQKRKVAGNIGVISSIVESPEKKKKLLDDYQYITKTPSPIKIEEKSHHHESSIVGPLGEELATRTREWLHAAKKNLWSLGRLASEALALIGIKNQLSKSDEPNIEINLNRFKQFLEFSVRPRIHQRVEEEYESIKRGAEETKKKISILYEPEMKSKREELKKEINDSISEIFAYATLVIQDSALCNSLKDMYNEIMETGRDVERQVHENIEQEVKKIEEKIKNEDYMDFERDLTYLTNSLEVLKGLNFGTPLKSLVDNIEDLIVHINGLLENYKKWRRSPSPHHRGM